jgi:hypothetical protein
MSISPDPDPPKRRCPEIALRLVRAIDAFFVSKGPGIDRTSYVDFQLVATLLQDVPPETALDWIKLVAEADFVDYVIALGRVRLKSKGLYVLDHNGELPSDEQPAPSPV